jgi:hypothetical protein
MSAATQLSSGTCEAISELAAILALISVKNSTAEKTLIGQEFARLLDEYMQLWEKAYNKASGARQAEIAKMADGAVEKLRRFVPGTGGCCVGGSGDDPTTCADSGGRWACRPPAECGDHP